MSVNTLVFSQAVLDWYDEYGRKKLPWKNDNIPKAERPYRIWLSEVMLQQTQVATVIPYYQRFSQAFPNLEALAAASQDEVLNLWSGLGYYARGRNLHKAAQSMWQEFGSIPNDFEHLLRQPGIGRSTAAAIMAQAFHQSHAILDGNVKRVLARFHAVSGWPGKASVAKKLWQYAEEYTPTARVADYTQAIMDLGAMVCTRSKPHCSNCPLMPQCSAYAQQAQKNYPFTKPKKEKPIKSVHVLCLIADTKDTKEIMRQEVLLEQRPPTGIWGGLWSFPEFASLQELDQHLECEFTLNTSDLDSQESFRHTFSHYYLDIHPHVLRVSYKMLANKVAEQERLFELSDKLDVGLPAPMQKLLSELV